MLQRNAIFIVLGVFILLYILPLGVRPLFVDDEARYGEIPREMIVSGDWVVPRLNGLRYFEKPVLGYWLNGASIMFFGETAFAVRLPSALSAGLSALFVFLLLRSRTKKENNLVAPLGALVFLTCFEVYAIGTFAVLDTMLSFFLTGAMFFFFFALTAQPGSWRERGFLAGAGFFCGLAFLVKGFLAFVVPGLAVAGYLVWQRRFVDLFRMAWLPLVVAFLTALPWGLLIHQREPDFWNFFFWNEHVRRFLGEADQHTEPFWYFMAIVPGVLLPWSFAIPAALSGLKNEYRALPGRNDLIRFSTCWLVLPFLFFSASSGKLVTYILPCFPPFAILLTLGFAPNLGKKDNKLLKWGAAVAAILFGFLLLVFIGIHLIRYDDFFIYSDFENWFAIAAALSVMCLFLLLAVRFRKNVWKIIFLGLSPVFLFIALQFNMPDEALQSKDLGTLLEQHYSDVMPETIILAGGNTSRTVCWIFKRDDIILLAHPYELEYGVNHDERGGRVLITGPDEIAEKINRNRGQIVLVARKRHYEEWLPSLPEPTAFYSSGPKGYVFVKY